MNGKAGAIPNDVYFCEMKFKSSFLLLTILLSTSCANIKGINGGPEDKKAPGLVLSKSSPQKQKNFKDRKLNFYFDEWIRIENPQSNISISPSLEFPAKYILKGKELIIELDSREQLKENTTYSIQFGESIKDITVGNVQRNLRYIFSTGDYIDSLKIEGQVKDAFSNQAKEKILVGLYNNLHDSAFQKLKPFYFCFTDTAGRFQLENLSPGEYKLYALLDKNQNYYFDQFGEYLAFLNQSISISDSTHQKYNLFLSESRTPLFIKDRVAGSGKLKLQFNEKPDSLVPSFSQISNVLWYLANDSLLVWNMKEVQDSLVLKYPGHSDSFQITPKINSPANGKASIGLRERILKPDEYPTFSYKDPILNVDLSKIMCIDSSISNLKIQPDAVDPRSFQLIGNFSNKSEFKLIFGDSAMLLWPDLVSKSDTFQIRYLDKTALSRLTLKLDSLNAESAYILELIESEQIRLTRNIAKFESLKELTFPNLLPGIYKLRLIEDKNQNRRWDGANYEQKIQAEPVWNFSLPELRADWDIAVTIKP